jgi:hypothetical protein
MKKQTASEFSKQVDDLNQVASRGHSMAAHKLAPDFEVNVAELREEWERLGPPALAELEAAIEKFGGDFERAAGLDYQGLRRAGASEVRIHDLQDHVFKARNFMRSALDQLSRIPGEIQAITPRDEAGWIHGNKSTDRIRLSLRGVLAAAADLRERHEYMKFMISELTKRCPPGALRREGIPRESINVH